MAFLWFGKRRRRGVYCFGLVSAEKRHSPNFHVYVAARRITHRYRTHHRSWSNGGDDFGDGFCGGGCIRGGDATRVKYRVQYRADASKSVIVARAFWYMCLGTGGARVDRALTVR